MGKAESSAAQGTRFFPHTAVPSGMLKGTNTLLQQLLRGRGLAKSVEQGGGKKLNQRRRQRKRKLRAALQEEEMKQVEEEQEEGE